jgi:hypothetical protein
MRLKATGHAAWIVAAGLWVCAAAVFPATDAAAQEAAQAPDQPAAVGTATGVVAAPEQPVRLHPKKSASKSRKAERQAKAKKPAQDETAKANELKPTQDDAISPAVANANAQWATDAKPADTYNMSAQAGNVLSQMNAQPAPGAGAAAEDSAQTEQVVAADQLNELDRAAEQQPPLTLAKATIDTPSAAPSATADNSKPWEQTSMIGKVFIALGGLLTLASAARMFMA